MPFQVLEAQASSILSATTGFIAEAGFTHSLTPARNCTFGCSYCYVPTMRIYGGLKPEDWRHWGQFTTFKSNAPELLRRQLREDQMIYCSPLVDPYQPAEETELMMPRILDELLSRPPKVFVIQTRGPLIVRDLARLVELSRRTTLRVSFSITTNRESVRKLYEPHCATHRLPIESDPASCGGPASQPSRRSRRYCHAIPRSWRLWRWKRRIRTSSAIRCMSDR